MAWRECATRTGWCPSRLDREPLTVEFPLVSGMLPLCRNRIMKKTKLLAALMLASLCGVSEAEAKWHKSEIKHLERQKKEVREEFKESHERLKELGDAKPAGVASDNWTTEEVEEDASAVEAGNWRYHRDPAPLRRVVSGSVKERQIQRARMKMAAMELEKIDRSIRKEKEQERAERELQMAFPPIISGRSEELS
jgi:hypothetical protein